MGFDIVSGSSGLGERLDDRVLVGGDASGALGLVPLLE